MITTIEQAIIVQKRRVAAGKFGYARAVLRFVRRAEKNGDNYYHTRRKLPVVWRDKE